MRPGAAWNANQTFIMSGTWCGFDADRETHTTRCKLERRIPPLKMLMASPRLQIACPGIGCGVQTVNILGGLPPAPTIPAIGTHLHVLPCLRAWDHHLQAPETVVKEGLITETPSDMPCPPRTEGRSRLTREPKSVCAPIAVFELLSAEAPERGGFLMHRDSEPLGSNILCL